jgi:hypothetical protein
MTRCNNLIPGKVGLFYPRLRNLRERQKESEGGITERMQLVGGIKCSCSDGSQAVHALPSGKEGKALGREIDSVVMRMWECNRGAAACDRNVGACGSATEALQLVTGMLELRKRQTGSIIRRGGKGNG